MREAAVLALLGAAAVLAAALTVVLAHDAAASPLAPGPDTASCTALTFGAAPTASSIGSAGAAQCFTFSGTSGDRIRVRVVETSGSLVAAQSVARPNSTLVCGTTTATDVTCPLDATGTHTVTVADNAGTNTGNFVISIQRLNVPLGCTALSSAASPIAGSLAAGQMNCYTFSGSVGDRIRLRMVRTSGASLFTDELVRPNGTTLCGPSGEGDLTCSLDITGTHTVIVEDVGGPNTGAYVISERKLNSTSGCTALAFGAAPTAGSITTVGQTDCYKFTGGSSGDEIRIRVVETSGTLFASQETIRPNGTSACAASAAAEVTCLLDTTGTHTVLVEDASGPNTGGYVIAVQKLDGPSGCAAITVGAAPTAASIGSAGETDCYTFTGAPGSRMRIRMVNTSGGAFFPVQELVRPDGTTICGQNGAADVTCALDDTGTYTVLVEDSGGTGTGNYALSVRKLNSTSGCTALSFGALPTVASISVAGETDCYKLSGVNAGDQLRVRVVETSGALFALQEVIRPNGTTACGQTSASESTCAADITGTYTVLVEDAAGTNTGNYVIAVQRLNAPVGCTPLSFGAAPIVKAMGAAGEMDCYTFTGSMGGRIRVRMVNTTGGAFFPLQEMVRPDGTTVCSPTPPNDSTCALDDSGTFSIVVRDAGGPNTGSYTMAIQRLNAASGCSALSVGAGPTVGSVSAAGEMDCYTFSGTQGDEVRVRVVETSGGLVALDEVVRPNGTTVCGQTSTIEVTCQLDTTGTHRIIVEDNAGTNTGGYVIAIQKLNAPVGCTALTFGAAPTVASISTAGEMDCYTFAGTAGDELRLRMVNTSGGAFFPIADVIRPTGTTACGSFSSNDGTCALTKTGTYTILVRDATGPTTGSYTMAIQRLNAPSGCSALSFGAAPTAASIGAAGQMDCFSFSATQGDQVRIRVVETSGSLVAGQEVLRPNGTSECFQSTVTEVTCAVDTTGTNTVVVEDNGGANTGGYVIAVQKLNAPVGCSALTFGGAPATASISSAGEMDCYTFSGTTGDHIRLRMVNTSGAPFFPVADFVRPNGTIQCSALPPNDSTCVLSKTGTFAIVVRDAVGPNTGNYTMVLQRLNAPTGCTALTVGGGGVAGSISTAGELDCYTFTGTMGDQINLQIGSSGPIVIQELVRPNGTTICGPSTGGTLACTLDTTGTYTVLVEDANGTLTEGYNISVTKTN